jgi:hypothetical protein
MMWLGYFMDDGLAVRISEHSNQNSPHMMASAINAARGLCVNILESEQY